MSYYNLFNKNLSENKNTFIKKINNNKLGYVVKVYEKIDKYFNYLYSIDPSRRTHFNNLILECINEDYSEFQKMVVDYFFNKHISYFKNNTVNLKSPNKRKTLLDTFLMKIIATLELIATKDPTSSEFKNLYSTYLSLKHYLEQNMSNSFMISNSKINDFLELTKV